MVYGRKASPWASPATIITGASIKLAVPTATVSRGAAQPLNSRRMTNGVLVTIFLGYDHGERLDEGSDRGCSAGDRDAGSSGVEKNLTASMDAMVTADSR